ncbi:hypothetical protein ACJD0Z_18325 [Flavobacteriaceae bacterium M23B6Z8]
MKTKEPFWFLGTLVLILIIFTSIFGLQNLGWNKVLDMNVHDTYFVISYVHLFLLFAVVFLWIVYLIRMLMYYYRKPLINLIFMFTNTIFTGILILFLNVLFAFKRSSLNTEYPPLSAASVPATDTLVNPVYNSTLVFVFFLLLLLSFVGYKTGQLYSK